jgi:cobalamin biosynthesis Mg chelatase CobN
MQTLAEDYVLPTTPTQYQFDICSSNLLFKEADSSTEIFTYQSTKLAFSNIISATEITDLDWSNDSINVSEATACGGGGLTSSSASTSDGSGSSLSSSSSSAPASSGLITIIIIVVVIIVVLAAGFGVGIYYWYKSKKNKVKTNKFEDYNKIYSPVDEKIYSK